MKIKVKKKRQCSDINLLSIKIIFLLKILSLEVFIVKLNCKIDKIFYPKTQLEGKNLPLTAKIISVIELMKHIKLS